MSGHYRFRLRRWWANVRRYLPRWSVGDGYLP